MKLKNKLLKINNLSFNTLLKACCVNNKVMKGYFRGYSDIDNDPEIPQLDILSQDDNNLYGLTENEIMSIEEI